MNYESLSEKSLVNKSKKGNTKAFEELIRRANDYLKNWMLKKTQCPHNAEELLQITYIKCWKNIKKFKGDSLFKTWACRIGYNLFLDELRKGRKWREQSLEETEDYHMFPSCVRNGGLKTLEMKDIKNNLDHILDSLPDIHRNVLVSFAIEELTYSEIAKKLGCSIGTVMSRLFYARKNAQKLIGKNKNLSYYGTNK